MTLKDDIKREEGLRLKPYTDTTGNLTIGYGTNLSAGIDLVEAELLLIHRITIAFDEAQAIFPDFHLYPESVKETIVHMLYQLGKTKFKKFKKMIAAIGAEDWKRAKKEALDSKWGREYSARAHRVATGFDVF